MSRVSKEKAWENMRQQVLQIADKLGRGVDAGIVDTVVVFRLLGLHTIMSCEGHIDRVTNGPYIMFGIASDEEHRRYLKELKDRDWEAYKEHRSFVQRENLKEREKLFPFLERFYLNRRVPYTQRIIIDDVDNKLSYLRCQGADRLLILDSEEEKREALDGCQKEMWLFTDFLRKEYFLQQAS